MSISMLYSICATYLTLSKGEKMVAVYLKQEFGGFAVHLLQK